MRFARCQLGLAIALGALALGANAQPATQPAPGTAPGAQAATQSAPAAKRATKQHAMPKHRAARQRSTAAGNMASGTDTGTPDSAYKAALRRCVTGPESSRESCLDEAIARYGKA